MDPISVLKTMWTHKWVSLPMVILIMLACAYGMLWAPRTYESEATFALAMPKLPSDQEIEKDPDLAKLNSDNPYLRWVDTSLLAEVVVARVNAPEIADRLEDRGLDGEFDLVPTNGTGSGMMRLTVTSDSPEVSMEAVGFLSGEFDRILREVQSVNQADELFLIEALPVSGPTPAEEVFSARLRSTAVMGFAGVAALVGAVSLAQSISVARQRARATARQGQEHRAGGRGPEPLTDHRAAADHDEAVPADVPVDLLDDLPVRDTRSALTGPGAEGEDHHHETKVPARAGH